MTGSEENIKKQIISDLEFKLDSVKNMLLEVLDEWYYYQSVVQPQILFDYERHFGDIEDELHTKKREATELERRAELISQKIKRGEKINEYTLKIVDLIIKKEFFRKEKLEQRANFQYQNLESSNKNFGNFKTNKNQNFKLNNNFFRTSQNSYYNDNFQFSASKIEDNNNFYGFQNGTNELKSKTNTYRADWKDYLDEMQIPSLYRSIVKRIHPDVKGETEDFKKYWHNVQEAYRTKNAHRLKLFFIALCLDESKEYSSIEEKEYSLRRLVNEFEHKLEEERYKLDNLKLDEPYVLIDKLKDRLWIAKRKRFLRDKLFQINKQIQMKQFQLNRLSNPNSSSYPNEFLNYQSNTNFANYGRQS